MGKYLKQFKNYFTIWYNKESSLENKSCELPGIVSSGCPSTHLYKIEWTLPATQYPKKGTFFTYFCGSKGDTNVYLEEIQYKNGNKDTKYLMQERDRSKNVFYCELGP